MDYLPRIVPTVNLNCGSFTLPAVFHSQQIYWLCRSPLRRQPRQDKTGMKPIIIIIVWCYRVKSLSLSLYVYYYIPSHEVLWRRGPTPTRPTAPSHLTEPRRVVLDDKQPTDAESANKKKKSTKGWCALVTILLSFSCSFFNQQRFFAFWLSKHSSTLAPYRE